MSEGKGLNRLRVVISGGGTGGHLYPGVAIGQEIILRYPDSAIMFVTGGRQMELDILGRSGFLQKSIKVEGIKGRGWRSIRVVLGLPCSLSQSISIIKGFAPHLVLGMGGYSSGPVCLAARIMGVPTAVHEQNSYPGLANRLLCRVVDRVFVSFEESRIHFPRGTIYLTGNPVRKEILEVTSIPESEKGGFTVLVMGGSQGARAVNKVFVEALDLLKGQGKEPRVIHQTGATDFDRVREDYNKRGISGEIYPFIKEMSEAYRRADLVVSRAGATSVSEMACLGKPSILIPYPYSANRHQETNARIMADAGGAEVVLQDALDGRRMADLLTRYMEDRAALKRMGESARKVGRAGAARAIVDHLEELAKMSKSDDSPGQANLTL